MDFGLRTGKLGMAPSKGVEVTVRTPSPWYGAKAAIKPNAAGNGTETELLSQIGPKLPGSDELVWSPDSEVNEEFADRHRGGGRQFMITGPTEQDRRRLRQKLLRFGIASTEEQKNVILPLADGRTREAQDHDLV